MPTLRQLLTQGKPRVGCETTSSKNSINKIWPAVEGRIRCWREFNLQTLNDSYGNVLNSFVPEDGPIPHDLKPRLADFSIKDDKDVGRLIDWNDYIISHTARISQTFQKLHPGIGLKHHTAGSNISIVNHFRDFENSKPDHLIWLDKSGGQKLLIGIGKTSTKWRGETILGDLEASRVPLKNSIWPLRQLAEMCKAAKIRYGYIQTNEETVVCCFTKHRENDFNVAIKSIPLSTYGENHLTSDLALWWLAMLAMSEGTNVNLTTEALTVPIDSWEPYPWGNCTRQVHSYSKAHRAP